MDEQRCSAPQIFHNSNSDTSDKALRRSASLTRAKAGQHQQVKCYAAQYTAHGFYSVDYCHDAVKTYSFILSTA